MANLPKHLNSAKDFPTEGHYAIIKFSSIYIPGDERSRTNPGHGYPAHNETTISYKAFYTKSEWEAEVRELVLRKDENFRAFKVEPANISIDVKVNIT